MLVCMSNTTATKKPLRSYKGRITSIYLTEKHARMLRRIKRATKQKSNSEVISSAIESLYRYL